MTQDSLARQARTSARNIARWEGGKNAPRSESVAAIAEATGQELSYFFRNGDEAEADEEEDEEMADLFRALLNRIDRKVEQEVDRRLGVVA